MSSPTPSPHSGPTDPTGPPGPPPPPIVVQTQSPTALGRYGKYLLIALVLSLIGLASQAASYRSYFSPPGGPVEKFHSLNGSAKKKIAIVTVAGTIMEGDGFVKEQIDRIQKDPDVVAAVLRINSPGGTVTGSDYLYHHFRELAADDGRKLPLVVSMGGICASGGYYIAMAVGDQADAIFAEPATWTGSIGVVIPHYDLSGLLARWDVEDDSIASHKFKMMGSPTRELSEQDRAEERALLQELVDQSFGRFKDIVVSGRPEFAKDPDKLEAVATGQIFTAQQALERGLIDRIGFLDEAIQRAAELAGVDPEQLRCVKYDEPATALANLIGAQGPVLTDQGRLDLAALLDLTAPRAYYLCTWLPALLSNR